jgi:5-methylcytosine-specific restriction endonuclease McrA
MAKSNRELPQYYMQLKTSAWLQRKYDILYRDNFVCSNCLRDNYESRLNVHHIGYLRGRKCWEYPDYLLVTLCEDCHKKEHSENATNDKNKIIQWIKRLLTPKEFKDLEPEKIFEKEK